MVLLEIYQNSVLFITLVFVLAVWTVIWKGIALWYSARNKNKVWFVLMMVLNTAGVLPIIYIFFIRPKKKELVIGKKEIQPKKSRSKTS